MIPFRTRELLSGDEHHVANCLLLIDHCELSIDHPPPTRSLPTKVKMADLNEQHPDGVSQATDSF